MDIPKEKLHELESFFKSISSENRYWYRRYWRSFMPTRPRERWQRWMFAATSIHTGWENNVAQYHALKDIQGSMTIDQIADKIKTGGMQHRKAKLIYNISKYADYHQTPELDQNWQDWRDEHVDKIWGIGRAKVSFTAELISPLQSKAICIDRHILDAFGQDKEKSPNQADYMEMEDIWLYLSKQACIQPAIARFIYWDIHIQKQPNSRYWSKLLEK